jgi:uncharacterized RDD family membrane protein YckC
MSTNDSFTWGAEALDRGRRRRARRSSGRRRGLDSSKRTSLLSARAAAVIIDGLVLVVPVFAIAFALSLIFPHRGFFFYSTGSSGSSNVRLGLPGALVVSALSLSYFFLYEALRGQTIGKRAKGLRVQATEGGPAGLNAISARTVLRLIDGLVFYGVGALVATLSGSRRRRLGDWLGGTIVVYDDAGEPDIPERPLWRVLAYPLSWTAAVLVAVFAFGLGTAAGADEQAISLVQSYVQARERGDGALACSMLSREQQRELVAIQTSDYRRASAARCPDLILSSDPASHLLNPNLPAFAAGPLSARYGSAGFALVRSRYEGDNALIVIFENGRAELDMRGVEKLEFVKGCVATGRAGAGLCGCLFSTLRADGTLESALRGVQTAAMLTDERRCRRI